MDIFNLWDRLMVASKRLTEQRRHTDAAIVRSRWRGWLNARLIERAMRAA